MTRRIVPLALGLLSFIFVGWAAGALWTSIVGSADLEAVRDVAEGRSDTLIGLARVITWAGSAYLLVPLALVCSALLVRAGLRAEAAAVVVSLAGAMLISDIVKLLVARPRPPVEHLQAVTGSSFPSGHSTQASAFWFSLVLALRAAGASSTRVRRATVLACVLVVGVATSRVYLGVHYPSDVIAGVLLGSGWSLYTATCVYGSADRAKTGGVRR